MLIDLFCQTFFHNHTLVNDHDTAAEPAHDVQIVGNKEDGHLLFGVQLQKQVQNLGLDRHIKRRNRLIRDHQARIHEKCHADADALFLTARKLSRMARRKGLVQSDIFKHFLHKLPALCAVPDAAQAQRFFQNPSDRPRRVERSRRILKYHLRTDAVTHLHLTRIIVVKSQDRLAERRFAAAALAHDPHNLSLSCRQVQIVNYVFFSFFTEQTATHIVKYVQIRQAQDLPAGAFPFFSLRNRRHQMTRIFMLRMQKDVFRLPFFHDLSLINHDHTATERTHNIQIMGNKENRRSLGPVDIPQKLQDLCLNDTV